MNDIKRKVSPFENALRNIFDEAHDKKVGSIEYPTWDFIAKHIDKLLHIAREGYVPREEKWKEVETTARNEYLRGYEEGKKEYESLPKVHGWVARDHSGILKIHECKPYRNENCGIWDNMDTRIIITRSLFPEITWESEPVEVELLVRKI